VNEQEFRNYLRTLQLGDEAIQASIEIAKRFEAYLDEKDHLPNAETAWAFSHLLIEEGINTEDNYEALIRYCRYIRNNDMFIAFFELVDGGEVGENLHRMVGERFGDAFRDEVFSGIGVTPYGTPSPEKPAYLQPVIERICERIGVQECSDLLSSSLRDLPDKFYLPEREKFAKAGNIDAYLVENKASFMGVLEKCRQEGRLFYTQEITPEVLEYIGKDPEMGGGRRVGSIIYETKIPYMTKQYMAETDPVMKRYYVCHCPWARHAIKNGDVRLSATFCYCSGGYHKKNWEIIFNQKLRVDILESALQGDLRCRFAIHLPEGAVPH
jgi:hypothetical protein